MKNYAILIVEDNEEDIFTYKRFLSKSKLNKYDVYDSGTVDKALNVLGEQAIDCIILDYNLPEKNGLDFIEMIRTDHKQHANIPIIILSGVKNKKVAEAAIQFQIADYLLKSHLDQDLLEKSIVNAIRRSKLDAATGMLVEKKLKDGKAILNQIKIENLVYILSHELMTPIAAINVFSQTLEDQPDVMSLDTGGYLHQISDYCTEIKKYLNNMLDVAIIDDPDTKLNKKQCSIYDLFKQVNEFKDMVEHERDLVFRISVGANLPDIMVDQEMFLRIIENLVNNSLKFTKDGSIEVGAFKKPDDNKNVYFYVKDTGSGIPKYRQKFTFDRVYQLINSDVYGLGLGLTIAYNMILLNGGVLELISEIDKGNTLTFSMPVV